MVGLPRRPAPDDCGRHHWHCSDAGWGCCGCSSTVSRRETPPLDEVDDCRRPDEVPDESMAAWLPEVDPDVCSPDNE